MHKRKHPMPQHTLFRLREPRVRIDWEARAKTWEAMFLKAEADNRRSEKELSNLLMRSHRLLASKPA
jgi:hypothetical protein